MRKIKFRAWDEENKKMWFTGQEGESTDNDWTFSTYFLQETGEFVSMIYGPTYQVTDDPYPITDHDERELPNMQYTGLKDKNGVEIYEGDVVRASSQGEAGAFEVKWRQEGLPCWILYPAWKSDKFWSLHGTMQRDGSYYDEVEVIGNRFKNPELLEADE